VDLRNPESRDEVALTSDDLRGPHDPCQAVGLAAHQLGLHGVIAPAATGLGETLACSSAISPPLRFPRCSRRHCGINSRPIPECYVSPKTSQLTKRAASRQPTSTASSERVHVARA
jgi:hypothetical protein